MRKKILGTALGNCVHIAGIVNFLELAKVHGYETVFMGPAVPVNELIDAVLRHNPDIVAIGYRLTPENADTLFQELKVRINEKGLSEKRFIFGGTPPVAEVAKRSGIFEAVFSGGESTEEILAYLKGEKEGVHEKIYPQTLVERIAQKYPFPLLRHHFGLPSLQETIKGARVLTESNLIDIISIAPDQNAQESFFRPEEMKTELGGAGGVPLRKKEDMVAIYETTRHGNFPLLRCYAGTRDLIQWAEILKETINNTWGAVPLCWYSQLDGRSNREIVDAIKENQSAIKFYATCGIPVEVTEAHQWALRECGDTIEVATAFLAAYNAKLLGVRHYVQQYMLNTPPGISPAMDLAKQLAKLTIIEKLHDGNFKSYRMIRTGLAYLSPDANTAKGQLAASIYTGMALEPHIVHVVSFSEGDHAAKPEEIIESCKIAMGAINTACLGMPNMVDERIKKRRGELLAEANILLTALRHMAPPDCPDPWLDPDTIATAVRMGILDAPHLKGNKSAQGRIITKIVDGTCRAIHPQTLIPISESERLKLLGIETVDVKLDRAGV